MLPSECLGTQHRLLVMDLVVKSFKAKKRSVGVARVRWWNLTRENATSLLKKIKSEASWKLIEDADKMWEGMAQYIRRSAKEVLGISRGGGGRTKGAWLWNDEVKEREKEKQNAYAALSVSTSEEEKRVTEATYKAVKKLAKKAIIIAKNNAYERLYQKLNTRDREKDVFKLAMDREKKTWDLGNIRCIKGEDGKVLVEEIKIRNRWCSYLSSLFNGESVYSPCLERWVQEGHQNDRACSCTSKEEVKDALRKIKFEKAIGSDLVPMKILKCLGEEGLE